MTSEKGEQTETTLSTWAKLGMGFVEAPTANHPSLAQPVCLIEMSYVHTGIFLVEGGTLSVTSIDSTLGSWNYKVVNHLIYNCLFNYLFKGGQRTSPRQTKDCSKLRHDI